MATTARALPGNMQAGEFLKFLKFRPNEERWQLIEGVAIMMNPPKLVHQLIALNLRDLLMQAMGRKGLDLFVLHESGVCVPGATHFRPRPDLAAPKNYRRLSFLASWRNRQVGPRSQLLKSRVS